MTEIQDSRERIGRHSHSKGVPKQVIQTWSVMGEAFDLESRYKVIDYLGAGAYGVVCAAQDSTENNVVAIKKCKKIFQSRTLAKRTLRELRLLRLFDHENVVKIKSVLKPLDAETFSEIYVVFEIMETDLAQIIRSPQTLKDQHVQYFTYQLLLALKYLHAANIVHRDLKPRNLLVNGDCCLKVADFGLARVYNDSNDSKILAMTEYVTTRWYRAPEVLVGWHRYTSAVDMWAVGCIVAELIGRMPLFPGADSMKQLDLLCRFSGKPSDEFIRQSRKASCRQYLNELPSHIKATDVRNLYPGANPQALDLVKKLLDFNPVTRITAAEALQHPYIQPMLLRNPSARVEPVLSFGDSEFLFEGQKASVDDLRAELLREVNSYLPKPLAPRSRSTLLVISEVDGSNGGTFSALASTTVDAQKKEKTALVTGGGSDEMKDKQRTASQNQSSGCTSTEGAHNNSNSTTSFRTPTHPAIVMATLGDLVQSKQGAGEDHELVRGSKRGRLETSAHPGNGGILNEKAGAVPPFGSSSSLSSDVSVMSDRMKALSTSAPAASVTVGTVEQAIPEGSSAENVLSYVRRGAKRASLALERPAADMLGGEAAAAVSAVDDAAEVDGDEECCRRHNEVDGSSIGAVGATDSLAIPIVISEETATETVVYSKGSSGKVLNIGKQEAAGGGSLYLCMGREYSTDNAEEGGTSILEESDGADGTCNFKATARNARRSRAARRSSMTTALANQKPDPCLIL